MNLWAKRIVQLSAVLAVVLFFLSCQDEASLLGYKNPNSKFQVNYVEIPIESSVLLMDSQRTTNFLFEDETNRFLVGQYADEQFGAVTSTMFTQFFTTSPDSLPVNSVFDSATLHLSFDFYNYGSKDASSPQTISVYEVEEEMINGRNGYFSRSELQVNPSPIGSESFTVDAQKFTEYLQLIQDSNSANDSSVVARTLHISLANSFGQKVFESAMAYSTGTDGDQTFINDSLFTKVFKGLALKSTQGDKILGFNPSSSASLIRLHYHTPEKDSLTVNLGFFFSFRPRGENFAQGILLGFSQIKSDRTSTPLAGLTPYSQDFSPSTDLRYIQSGTGVYTRLDFGKFLEFADTVPNIVINSAELIVGSVEESANYPLSSTLVLRILNDDNRIEKYSVNNAQDNLDISFYNPTKHAAHRGTIAGDDGSIGDADNALFALGDQDPYLQYSSDTKSFNGNYSLFFQQLSIIKENKRRFKSVILYPAFPSRPSSSKTVNRTVFSKGDIKLKIYYTKPTVPLN